jgi:PAS domain S-box-containing protein
MVQSREKDRIRSELERRADNYVAVLQSGVSRTLGVLRLLAAYNVTRCDIGEPGYAAFVEGFKDYSSCSLSCHRETQLLGWALRVDDSARAPYVKKAQISCYRDFQFKEYSLEGGMVTAEKREEYFVIYNIEPFEEKKHLLGFDIASEENYLSAIEKARDTGKTAATGWIELEDSPREYGFMLFLPLYKDNIHYDTIDERREYLDGFVVGLFGVNDLAEIYPEKYDMSGLNTYIYDKGSFESDERFIYRLKENGLIAQTMDEFKRGNFADLRVIKSLDVGGREWQVLLSPNDEFLLSQKGWQSKGFFVIGLLLTFTMVIYLVITAGEAAYIEELVKKRTAELAATNKDLANEIINRKHTERALKKSEEDYKHIYNNAQVGLFRVRINDGIALNVNTKFAQMFGYDSQEEAVDNFSLFENYVNPDDYKLMLDDLREKGEVKNIEAPLLRRDDLTIWVRIWARIYPDNGYIEGVATDITEDKQVEENNKKLQAQLFQSQKMEFIGRLAGGIAHDFNNMLTGIIGYAVLSLRKISKDHPVYNKLKVIEASGKKAAELTHQILAFSRKQILNMEVVNLNAIVESMSKMFGRIIGDDIQLELRTEKEIRNVKADQSQMEQILMNLVVNARDAMLKGGHLVIETKDVEVDEEAAGNYEGLRPGSYVMLIVTDTGVGMGEGLKERIFEPFFTSKQKGKGTGLGLSTVFGIVKQHNGYIWVDSKEGEGAIFKVYLPVTAGGVVEEKEEDLVSEMEQGTETILVVDDEPFIRNFLLDTLEPLGYKVLTASNSDEAFKISHSEKEAIDVLLTDVVMPGADGKQLAESIKSRRPEIKIIYMSGYTDDIIVHHGVLTSGVEFLQKPLSPDDVVKKIRDVLDRDKVKNQS